MNRDSHVVVIDTPSIKKFVFGTDTLNEVRGASALLDWLNQEEMKKTPAQPSGYDTGTGGNCLCQRWLCPISGNQLS